MNRLSWLIGTLLFAATAVAQEPEESMESIDTVPVSEPEAPMEEAAIEEPVAEAPARDPIRLYVGADIVSTTLSISGPTSPTSRELDSDMIRLNGGWRLAEGMALEMQLGFGQGGDAPDEAKTDGYVGLYLVPSATLFELVDLTFPVGYSRINYNTTGGTVTGSGLGYGFGIELPLERLAAEAAGVRLGIGFQVYSQDSENRSYGANIGIRYEFDADLVRPTQLFDGLLDGF